MPNFSTSLFDTTASLEVSNQFETLSSLSEPDSPVPDNIGPPKQLLRPLCSSQKKLGRRSIKRKCSLKAANCNFEHTSKYLL